MKIDTSPIAPNAMNPREPKRVTIGPVDSGHPRFDEDLRQYLAAQGFTGALDGVQWTKEFPNALAADFAIEAAFAQIGRLVGTHAPQLPNVSLL